MGSVRFIFYFFLLTPQILKKCQKKVWNPGPGRPKYLSWDSTFPLPSLLSRFFCSCVLLGLWASYYFSCTALWAISFLSFWISLTSFFQKKKEIKLVLTPHATRTNYKHLGIVIIHYRLIGVNNEQNLYIKFPTTIYIQKNK